MSLNFIIGQLISVIIKLYMYDYSTVNSNVQYYCVARIVNTNKKKCKKDPKLIIRKLIIGIGPHNCKRYNLI